MFDAAIAFSSPDVDVCLTQRPPVVGRPLSRSFSVKLATRVARGCNYFRGEVRTLEARIDPAASGGLGPVSLVRYVLHSWVDLLCTRTYDRDHGWVPVRFSKTHEDFAELIWPGSGDTGASKISRLVSPGRPKPGGEPPGIPKHLSRRAVTDLEYRLLAFAHDERGATPEAVHTLGWLTSFWEEQLGSPLVTVSTETTDTTVRSAPAWPARWFHDLCEVGPQNSAQALMLGEALISLLAATHRREAAQDLLSAHVQDVRLVTRGLVAIATRPPGGGSVSAVQLAAQLGQPTLPIVREYLERSALGFRTIRILTRMLALARAGRPHWWSSDAEEELNEVWSLLSRLADRQLGQLDPYPARSFLVEALREANRVADHFDLSWQPTIRNWLVEHVQNSSRPIRERVYAAYCLNEVDAGAAAELIGERCAIEGDEYWHYLVRLREILTAGRQSLEEFLLDGHNVSPHKIDEGNCVHRGVTRSPGNPTKGPFDDLPTGIQRATRQLVRYALLSPDGTMRRRASETLREAGVAAEAATAVNTIMRDPESPRWLVELAAFILGYLEDPVAIPFLEELIADGLDTIDARGPNPSSAERAESDPSVLHAAFFARGDLRKRTPEAIELARRVLEAPTDHPNEVIHAATYALAVLRPELDESGDLDDDGKQQHYLLFQLVRSSTSDPITKSLADWGVENIARHSQRRRGERDRVIWGLDHLDDFSTPSPPAI